MKIVKQILFAIAALFTAGWLLQFLLYAPGVVNRARTTALTAEDASGFLMSHFANNLIVLVIAGLITYGLWVSVRKRPVVLDDEL